MKKITFFTIFILCFTGIANAQFFKKLGEKAEKAAEKAIERKVEQKSKRETEKAFDSTFNKKKKKRKKKRKKNRSSSSLSKVNPAVNYIFNHRVEMKMQTNKEVMDIDYYLSNTDKYFGMAIKDKRIEGDFKMVYDVDSEAMFTFMVNAGQKMKMGVSFQTGENTTETSEFTIKATGKTKTIIGYHCNEYKMNGKDMTATIWVTKDVNIRFPSTLYSGDKNKNNNQEWMKDLDGWAMEMVMLDTSNRKPQTITMTCLSINTSNLIINSSDYKNIGY